MESTTASISMCAPPRVSRCALHLLRRTRLPDINTVDKQHLAALRLAQSKVSCLFVVFCGGSPTPVWREHAAFMVGGRAQKGGSDDC